MKEILHFKSTQERLAYLRGGLEEIKPQEAKKKPKKAVSKPKAEKKGEKVDEVPAE